jgi:hypothetical protein
LSGKKYFFHDYIVDFGSCGCRLLENKEIYFWGSDFWGILGLECGI